MIENLKDLERLLKLCRRQGVTEIKLGTTEFKLGDLPQESGAISKGEEESDPANPYANFPKGELTAEQLIFYSSGGRPEDDPHNKEAQ